MAQYSALLGKRIDVTYRAGDIVLPTTGHLAADSGKSIFLEESYQKKGNVNIFRWEIPYQCIVQLNECPEGPQLHDSANAPREAASEPVREPGVPEMKNHPEHSLV